MARPPVFPVEEKVRIVLSILAGEVTVAEAARRAKVSEQSVGNWKRQFLEAGKTGLVAGKSGASTREARGEGEARAARRGGRRCVSGRSGTGSGSSWRRERPVWWPASPGPRPGRRGWRPRSAS